jgi:NADH:ubiquinone oxidoreductase subunit 4 (subunit M)
VLHQDVGSAVPAEALDLRPAEVSVIAPLVVVLLFLSFWPAAITDHALQLLGAR